MLAHLEAQFHLRMLFRRGPRFDSSKWMLGGPVVCRLSVAGIELVIYQASP
jgi:hypothetical protein